MQLSAGAFSDAKAVEASKQLVNVFVDCDWGKKNTDLSSKYKVRGYPTVIFTDLDGNQVDELRDRSPGGLLSQINEIATKHGRKAIESWDDAAKAAKKSEKRVLYFFSTTGSDSAKLEEALYDDSNKDLLQKFVVARTQLKPDNPEAKRFGIASSPQPVILVLDPDAEKPEAAPLKKIVGKLGAKELHKELESVVVKKGA